MAGAKDVRTMCQVLSTPAQLDDGTLCRCESPLAGPVGTEPWTADNFRWPLGAWDISKPFGEEGWFEHRYPNLLEDARLQFTEVINTWVQKHWGSVQFPDQRQRIKVYARKEYYEDSTGKTRVEKKSDNRFERCGEARGVKAVGDKPQDAIEADQVLGAFWLDIETPVAIRYSHKDVGGATVQVFEWSAVMYVGDVIGLQENNRAAQWPIIGGPLLWAAPSRKVKRARWMIHGEGERPVPVAPQRSIRVHRIAAGDTLSRLAQKYYGNAALWPILYAANRETIGNDPNQLRAGDTLRIPDLDELSPSEKARAMSAAPKGDGKTIAMPPLR